MRTSVGSPTLLVAPLAVAFLLALTSFPPTAAATTLLQADLDALVGASDRIVVGRVLSSTGRFSEDGRRIVTDHRVAVERSLVGGPAGEVLVVRTAGGKVGEVRMLVRGSPVMHKGDRLLLFTEVRGAHRWVVGMKQGAMRVLAGAGGRLSVRPDLSGVHLVRRDASGRLVRTFPTEADRMPRDLSEVVAAVRAARARCQAEVGRCQVR